MGEKKPIDEALDVALRKAVATHFQRQIEYRTHLKAKIDQLEREKNTYDAVLIEHLLGQGQTGYQDPDGRFSAAVQSRRTAVISRGRLIAEGVPVEKIEAATVVSVSDPFLVVRLRADP
jgi:hypothetical protein